MPDPKLDPRLEDVVAREVAAGNAIVSRGEAPDGRVAVQLERPFHEEYRTTLGEDGIYFRREEMHDPRASYEYDDEILETAASQVLAPTPEGDAYRERAARAKARGSSHERWLKEGPPPKHEMLAQLADAIERELRRLQVWLLNPPPEPPKFHRAFGGDVMPFTDWIQLVMIPRMREIAATKGVIPGSGVAAYAVRELDGQDEFSTLLARLGALDRLLVPAQPPFSTRSDRRILAAGIGLILLAFLIAICGVRLANRAGQAVDRGYPDEIILPLDIRGFSSPAIHSVEARVEASIEGDDALEPRVISLVTARSVAMHIGLRPLDLGAVGANDRTAITAWLEANGAKPVDESAQLDARRLASLASAALAMKRLSALKAGLEFEGLTLRTSNEPSRFHGRAPDSVHNTILIAILLALLLPVPFFAVWLRRRFVLAP